MIETFKLVHGIYDQSASLKLNFSAALRTRGNSYRIDKKHLHYDISKYFFRNRIISVWNRLPEDVVTAESVNCFKHSLDKFWSDQELLYHWRADITGTGSRSCYSFRQKCV